MDPALLVFMVCVVVFTIAAAYTDWRSSRLPNVLTVSAFGAALLFHIVYGAMNDGMWGVGMQLLIALAGFATGFGILFVMWAMGKGAGGDVKYMGALGAWLGAAMTFRVFLVVGLLVVVGAIFVLAWQFITSGMGRTKSRYLDLEDNSKKKKATQAEAVKRKVHRRIMPFGVPAALATWLVLAVSVATGRNLPLSGRPDPEAQSEQPRTEVQSEAELPAAVS
ncbi:MAG: prepilin peptidase [Planctomycetales bacterium]|nr:prepilin peptidase [Planctomycetales bacterium]